MSLVFITFHTENVQNIEAGLPNAEELRERYKGKPTYKSIHSNDVVKQYNKLHIIPMQDGTNLLTDAQKFERRTMGYAKTPLKTPCAYLKKHEGVKWRRENDHKCVKKELAPVPKFPHKQKKQVVEEEPPKEKLSKKNQKASVLPKFPHPMYFRNHKHRADFVKLNTEKFKAAPTKYPKPHYIDDENGHRIPLIGTGTLPEHVCSRRHGKVPCYIRAQQQVNKRNYEEACEQQYNMEVQCIPGTDLGLDKIPTKDRLEILEGLKTNYHAKVNQYLQLPLLVESFSKKKLQKKLENEMNQLEKDIALFENNENIFTIRPSPKPTPSKEK